MKKNSVKSRKIIIATVSIVLVLAIILSLFFLINRSLFTDKNLSTTNFDNKNWMKNISDDTFLGDINIPGSHDAAAINQKTKGLYSRHFTTITEQLNLGIRLLDIRLQFQKNDNNPFDFLTCHGNIGSSLSLNTYQNFESLLKECEQFLKENQSETIIMSLKIDDYKIDSKDDSSAKTALKKLLSKFPIRPYDENLGTLGSARGQIILFNRIDDQKDFGYPMGWNDNPPEDVLTSDNLMENKRTFSLGVQDYYNVGFNVFTANKTKATHFFDAVSSFEKGKYDAIFNFASACTVGFIAISPYKIITEKIGENSKRPLKLGWVLMDYEDTVYNTDKYGKINLINLIIDSNKLNGKAYSNYPEAFTLK